MTADLSFGLEDFLAARPPEGRIRAGYFSGLKPLVSERGRHLQGILEAAGLEPHALDDPDESIDCRSAALLLEVCREALNDPLVGLQLAGAQCADVFGAAMAAARAAPDLGQALRAMALYMPVTTSPECVFELRPAREVVEVRWSTHLEVSAFEQANLHGLHLMLKILRALVGSELTPLYTNVAFGASARRTDAIEEKVGSRLRFRSGTNAICIPAALLETPLPSANRLLFALLGHHLSQAARAAQPSVTGQARFYIRAALGGGGCTIEQCARRLKMPSRTLQKRLAAGGVSFSELVDDERCRMARAGLADRTERISEIAFNLGYADQSSFARAFRRWTGLSPQGFRAQRGRLHG